MIAVVVGRVDSVHLLVDRGANVRAKSEHGRTVLWWANVLMERTKEGDCRVPPPPWDKLPAIIQMLKQAGAKE